MNRIYWIVDFDLSLPNAVIGSPVPFQFFSFLDSHLKLAGMTLCCNAYNTAFLNSYPVHPVNPVKKIN
jgi:hypothetical protein